MPHVQAVLFDLGNTLTVTASLAESLMSAELSPLDHDRQLNQQQRLALGQRIERHIKLLSANAELLQPHWRDVWRTAASDCGITLSTDAIEGLCRAHLRAFVNQCQLQSYTIPLLSALRREDIPLGLISNVTGPVEVFEIDLQVKGLAPFFKVVVWSSAVGYRKPHPRIFQTALESLGLNASERVIMVGDHEQADILGAKAMGFTTVRVAPSNATPVDSEADYLASGTDLLSQFQTILCSLFKPTSC